MCRLPLRMLVASGAIVALLAAGCSGDGGKSAAKVTPVDGSGAIEVTAADTAFSVSRIEVKAGTTTTITLLNHDNVPHTLRVYAGDAAEGDVAADTGEVVAGDSGEAVVLFASPGEHPFRCAIHPQQMRGTLVVR